MSFGYGTIAICALLILSMFALVSKENFKGKELLLAFAGLQLFLILSERLLAGYLHYPFSDTGHRVLTSLQGIMPFLYIVQWIIFYLFITNLVIPAKTTDQTVKPKRYESRQSRTILKDQNQQVRIDRPRSDTVKWIALGVILTILVVLYNLYRMNKGIPV